MIFPLSFTLLLLGQTLGIPAAYAASTGKRISLGPREGCKDKGGQGGGGTRGQWRNHHIQQEDQNQGEQGQGDDTRIESDLKPSPKPSDIGNQNNVQVPTSTKTQTRTVAQVQTSSAAPKPEPTSEPEPQPQPNDDGQERQSQGDSQIDDSNTTGKISSNDPRELLKLHNEFRAGKGKGALSWDQSLSDRATKYALNCPKDHSGQGPENLAWGTGSNGAANVLFGSWTSGEKHKKPGTYNHYTQVIWGDAQNLGCGLIDCPAGTIFESKYGETTMLICQYDTGNVIGQNP